MSDIRVAKRYAKSLLAISLKDQNSHSSFEQLALVINRVFADVHLTKVLNRPNLSTKLALEIVGDLSQKIDLTLQAKTALQLIAESGRFNALQEILEQYKKLYQTAQQKISGKLVTAQALDQEYQEGFRLALKKNLGREVEIECEHDQSIIGGAVFKVGDFIFDMSVRKKLHDIVESALS